MASESANLAIQIYKDFAAKNIPAMLAAFHPQIDWTVSDGFPYAGNFIGPDAVLANVVQHVPNDWDGFRHEISHHIDAGDHVAVVGTYYGTWKRTGRSMEAPFVHTLYFEKGKLVTFRQYVDVPATMKATDGFEHRQEMTATR